MIKLTEINTECWLFIIFFTSSLVICIFILVISFFLGGRSKSYSKNITFESGMIPLGDSRIKFTNKFYLLAICFIIFDVESIYLYSWCIAVRENGWMGFIEAIFFILFLLLNLVYIMKLRVLDWIPKYKYTE